MNIIQLASGDLWAGAEVQLFHLACALDSIEEIQLSVVLLNRGQLADKLIEKGVKVLVLDEAQLSSWAILKQLKEYAAQFKPNIIHTHRTKENILGGLVAKFVGCKNVRTLHGDSEGARSLLSFRANILFSLDRIFARLFQHKIIAVSEELNKKISQRYQKSKVLTINNSINVDYVLEKSNEEIDLDFSKNEISIGFVGRFVPVKRVDLFYQIAKETAGINHTINFYMIGDGPLFDKIRNLIKQDSLEHRIHLVGFVENSAPYLKQLDYLLFTSEHEGLPMTLLESMALETVVISTHLPSIKSILKGDECGFFPESEDPKLVAEYIDKLTQDKTLRNKKALGAKNILKQDYSLESNLQKYLSLYQKLLY